MAEFEELEKGKIFPLGQSVDGSVFTGRAWNNVLVGYDEFNCPAGSVTFAPGARNYWHVHAGGQVLFVTGGRGRYQEEGKPARELREGDVVRIPAGVKHWHGAAADSWFVHIYIEANPSSGKVTWLGPVTDEDYGALDRGCLPVIE